MQSPAYAHRVKLSNLQQMANTIIYVQEHGFDTQSDLKNTLLASKQELKEMQTQFAFLSIPALMQAVCFSNLTACIKAGIERNADTVCSASVQSKDSQ